MIYFHVAQLMLSAAMIVLGLKAMFMARQLRKDCDALLETLRSQQQLASRTAASRAGYRPTI